MVQQKRKEENAPDVGQARVGAEGHEEVRGRDGRPHLSGNAGGGCVEREGGV